MLTLGKRSPLSVMLAVVANCALELHQLDVKTAFLDGMLEEDVYCEPSPGVVQALFVACVGCCTACRTERKRIPSAGGLAQAAVQQRPTNESALLKNAVLTSS